MNTKILMTGTSLLLGLAGIVCLFAPDALLQYLGVDAIDPLLVAAHLFGALYLGFAFMNWTAKDSAIGGVYARPVSIANFAHFFVGALVLVKYQFAHPLNPFALILTAFYAVFAVLFYWLVFRATGLHS